jgi:predicted membrane-bound spermidine synthase
MAILKLSKKLSANNAIESEGYENVKTRIKLIEQNATTLSLDKKDFKLVIIPFNSFLCIPEFKDQCKTLKSIANHLADDGILVMDVVSVYWRPVYKFELELMLNQAGLEIIRQILTNYGTTKTELCGFAAPFF